MLYRNINLKGTSIIHLFNKTFIEHLAFRSIVVGLAGSIGSAEIELKKPQQFFNWLLALWSGMGMASL